MRVLMTLDAVGGVWRYALDLAAGLRPLGVETVFLGAGPAPSPARRAEAEARGTLDWLDAPLDWLARDEDELARVPELVARAARRHGADLVHLNLPSQAAGIDTDRPVVAVSHSCVATWFRAVRGATLPPDWSWQGRLTARGLRRADAAVAPSHAHAAAVEACYGRLPRLRVVANATAAPEGEPGDGPFAVASGRWWDEGKGAATLDAAAEHSNWPIHLLGPLRGANGAAVALRHAVAEGEAPHAEAVARMQGAGAFVSASLYEPFGLAVAEAARLGLPLVLSDIPTFRELWGGAALLFAPGDAEGLVRHLDRLAADPALRRSLGALGRDRARPLTLAAQARGMMAVYGEAQLARRAPPPLRRAG